jgi:cleavage stimulation factor subunit 3
MYTEQLKMDAIRRTFHIAITMPINNVEALWKDYDSYENGLNKLTAKKFIGEKSGAYMTARTALRELRNIHDTLVFPEVSNIPNTDSTDNTQVPLRVEFNQGRFMEKVDCMGVL